MLLKAIEKYLINLLLNLLLNKITDLILKIIFNLDWIYLPFKFYEIEIYVRVNGKLNLTWTSLMRNRIFNHIQVCTIILFEANKSIIWKMNELRGKKYASDQPISLYLQYYY